MQRLLVLAATIAIGAAPAYAAPTKIPPLFENCTNLNKTYKHGIGRAGAHDKTTGDPVTNFTRSTKLYNKAMSYNRGLDRDKDGVACEKL
ncbi:MAG: excalibur calcium-binding domain-containing protein [Gaiellaceae bacterium]